MAEPSCAPLSLSLTVTQRTSSPSSFLLLLLLSPTVSPTPSLLSDSSQEPQALRVLTTHLDLFFSLIIHRSQLAHPQTPHCCNWCGRCSCNLPHGTLVFTQPPEYWGVVRGRRGVGDERREQYINSHLHSETLNLLPIYGLTLKIVYNCTSKCSNTWLFFESLRFLVLLSKR